MYACVYLDALLTNLQEDSMNELKFRVSNWF